MENYRILAINPGSTSTKVALFEGKTVIFSETVRHDSRELSAFSTISDQLAFRRNAIKESMDAQNAEIGRLDAVVGRGGGLVAVEGGTYIIDDVLYEHAVRGANGIQHPAQLGPQLAREFSIQYGCPAYVVNPPDTDEFQELARITGVRGVYRISRLHTLNLKETAIRHAEIVGKPYESSNYIVCHIGGGVSVSAHKNGRVIDGCDIVGGDGPMAPTRCGSMPVAAVIELLENGMSLQQLKNKCMTQGGFADLLGTSDVLEIEKRIADEDAYASLIWRAFKYQICKYIGSMAAVLGGNVDGILLGGGIVRSQDLVRTIEEQCGWIAPVTAYPGEFEMEAMAAGAARVLSGQEQPKRYLGKPFWSGFFMEEDTK